MIQPAGKVVEWFERNRRLVLPLDFEFNESVLPQTLNAANGDFVRCNFKAEPNGINSGG